MAASIHIPVLRAGKPYRSLDVNVLTDIRTGEPVAEVSLANRGLIARDLADAARHQRALGDVPIRDLFAIAKRAADLFTDGELSVDPVDGVMQTPDDYVRQLSSTTGMPHALCRGNMKKIAFVLGEMERVIQGLARGLDLDSLDRGWTVQDDRFVSYQRQADVLGAVLPSNSPGVHSLWIPAIGLKIPVALKPGSQEPWTPLRIGQALIAAGLPPEAIGYYPADYAGSQEILLRSGRSMMFGDASTVGAWASDPRVELHGPGWSKVILGDDLAPRWKDHLDLMVASAADNGGRSCINASGVWTPADGRAIAEALAERFAKIEAKPLDDPDARIAAFSNPAVAHRISEYIDAQLDIPGAVDMTAKRRPDGRVTEVDGCTFLLPTVVWCEDPGHPLASAEFLFPFVAVAEVPGAELLDRIGPTLVASGLTEDPAFSAALLASRDIDRLNLGPFPTSKVSWDQPHEGNLFLHLYHQRAFQTPLAAAETP